MNSIRQIYDQISQNVAISKEVEQAEKEFSFKPFVVEFRRFSQFVGGFRWVLAGFSVITGFGFLYFTLATNLHWIAAGLFSVLILAGLEYAKGFTNTLTAKRYFQRSKMFGAFLVFGLAFGAASVYFSLLGAKELHKRLDGSLTELEQIYTAKQDSIRKHYTGLVQAEKADFAQFKKSVSYKGKINIYNPAVRKRSEAHTRRLERIENERAAALKALEKQWTVKAKETKQDNDFSGTFWLCIAGVNECLIVGALWFLMYYKYRTVQEKYVISEAEKVGVSISEFQHIADYIRSIGTQSVNVVPSLSANHVPAGFRFQSTQSPTQSGTQSADLTKTKDGTQSGNSVTHSVSASTPLSERKALLRSLIQSGCKDYRTLAQTAKVNFKTISEVMQDLQT